MGLTLATAGGNLPATGFGTRELIEYRRAIFDATARGRIEPIPRFYTSAQPEEYRLPETPLRSPIPASAEDLGIGTAASLVLLGYRRTLTVLNLARKAAIYSGHPGLDVPFLVAWLRVAEVEEALARAQNAVLSIRVPDTSPIRQRSIAERFAYNFPNQAELDQLYLFGLSGDIARARARLEELRAREANPFRGSGPQPYYSDSYGDRANAIQAGLAARAVLEEQRTIIAQRLALLASLATRLFGEVGEVARVPVPLGSVDP